jgi:hypothetical protein
MLEPTDREILLEIRQNLATHIERMANVCKDVEEHGKTLYGDGSPGLKSKVQDLDTKMGGIITISKAVMMSTVGALVAAIWAVLQK